MVLQSENESFIDSLRSFVGIDQFGLDCKSDLPLPPDVVRATNIFKETMRLVDNHYEIGLPWIDEEPRQTTVKQHCTGSFLKNLVY